MRELIEIVQVLNVQKPKASSFWDYILEPGSLMAKFFEGLQSGLIQNDEDALKILYPGEQISAKYKNLKERLKERLLSIVFLFDLQENTESSRQQAYFECSKKLLTANILLSKGAKTIGINELEALLKQATYYEFTEITVNILSTLKLHYGILVGDNGHYQRYRNLFKHYQHILSLEHDVEDDYVLLSSQFTTSKSTKENISIIAREKHERYALELTQYDSFRLFLNSSLLETLIYTSINDHKNTILVCEKAITYFKQKKFESYLPLQIFYYQLIVCNIQLRQYEQGEKIIKEYGSLFTLGSFNWIKLQESWFLLSMHTENYQKGLEVYLYTENYIKKTSWSPVITEMWKIYEAYLYFLYRIGKIETTNKNIVHFKPAKFANEIQHFSKDKKGMNIPAIIIQLLINIVQRNFYATIERVDAIEKYSNRHLQKDHTYRSRCFIKALLEIPKSSFQMEKINQRAEKHLGMLHEMPLEIANQGYEIEVIPYEILWKLVCDDIKMEK